MILRARIISFAFDYVRNKKQLKDLASEMGVDPASLNRAMYGNARLDSIEKMATALGVPSKFCLNH